MSLFSITRSLIVKPAPVVSDDELHSLHIEHQIDEYPLGVRMFHGIVYSLLSDAEKIALDQLGQWPEGAIDFNLRVDGSVVRQSPRGLGQRAR